jgi:hypothetical protein
MIGLFLRASVASIAISVAIACAVVATIVEASERAVVSAEPSRVALKDSLMRAALTMPRPHDPGETETQYRDRLRTIVDSIGDEAPSRKMAFTVLVTWESESRFDRRVHAGLPHPVWTSDHGRARCLAQIQQSSLTPDWSELAGTDGVSTRRCARATVRILLAQTRLCRSRGETSLAGILAAYGSGRSCEPTPETSVRAARAEALMRRF